MKVSFLKFDIRVFKLFSISKIVIKNMPCELYVLNGYLF